MCFGPAWGRRRVQIRNGKGASGPVFLMCLPVQYLVKRAVRLLNRRFPGNGTMTIWPNHCKKFLTCVVVGMFGFVESP